MEKRKDSKGRVLKEGESERSDGRYQYRYTDRLGKRNTVYSKDLKSLREKEQEIQQALAAGMLSLSSKMTVREITNKYLAMHKGSVKDSTYNQFEVFKSRLEKDSFGNYNIKDVTITTAKIWLASLYNSGLSFGTVNNYKAILKPSFDLALDDGIIARNPFDFSLGKIIKNNAVEKKPLSLDEYLRFVSFAREHDRFFRTVDEIILLYETGLRVSELCGLTFSDIDLEENILKINKQMVKTKNKERHVQTLKTQKSNRIIPISPAARESILNLTINRPKVKEEKEVDGHSDFLIIASTGRPKIGADIEYDFRMMVAVYNKMHPDNTLPHITPHTLRHTFCTRMILSGMNIKAVQYLMGHSTISVTLNVYTHMMSSADAIKEFESRLSLSGSTPTLKEMSNSRPNSLTPMVRADTALDTGFAKLM